MDEEFDRVELELAEASTYHLEAAILEALRSIAGEGLNEFDVRCCICALIVIAAEMHVQMDYPDSDLMNLVDVALESVREQDDE